MRFERNCHNPLVHVPEVHKALRSVDGDVVSDSVYSVVPNSLHTSGTARWKAANQR